jgi:succinoglycan biosynthesis protein ExoM
MAQAAKTLMSDRPDSSIPDGAIAVGLCTYKRPDGLARALDHIALTIANLNRPVSIIVVNNDADDKRAEPLTAAFSARTGVKIYFETEPTPGISAARDAIFARADAIGVRWLAMMDDDEWPTPGWLYELLATQARTKASVVGGPVEPVFPEGKDDLKRLARYWTVAPQLLDGRPFVFCTCNFVIDLEALRDRPRPLFDPAFGLSGGGDTVFFRSLFYSGLQMAWAPQAIMKEEVPPSRASVAWLRTRRFRGGNHAVQWETRDAGAARTAAKTLALVARLAFYPLLRREPESPMTGWLLECDKVRGRIASHLGTLVVEYARPGQPPTKACR